MSVAELPGEEQVEEDRLRWRGGFGRLWSAAVVSRLGDALRGAALPLLAVSLTDDALLISLVTACGFLPWAIFGLLGGALADRMDQRRAMWLVDVVRAVLVAGFAVLVGLGQATIGALIALAFALTTLQTLFDNAATALLPSVVPTSVLGQANARLMTGQEVMGRFVGAPLVPVLLAVGAWAPYGADAVTYLLAAALVGSLRQTPPKRSVTPGRTLRRDVAEGVRVLWHDRGLRALCVSTTVCNIGIGALIATLVLLVTDWLGAGNSGYALVITVYGAGSVLGGLVSGWLTTRLGQTRSMMGCAAAQVLALAVLGGVRGLPVAVLALAVFGFSGMVWNVTQVTMMQRRSPKELLGRVSAGFRTLTIAGTPLGALLGGLVAGAWGANTPALLASALMAVGVMALLPALRHDGTEPVNSGPAAR